MKRLAATAGIVAIAVVGCSTSETSSQEGLLEDYELAGKDGAEVIEHLDQLAVEQRPTELMASVETDELLLTDGAEQISMQTPEDSVYVSVAPYIDQTHDCFYHSLTTCLGELSQEDIEVTITDESTGETLVEEETTTYDNGFIGYWLPRDTTVTMTVSQDEHTGSTDFSTAEDGPTCVTDLQLDE